MGVYQKFSVAKLPVSTRSPQGGFTLVELMVVLVVLAVLLTIGVPSFVNLIRENRLLSATYDMRSALGVARSEALAQRAFVSVCASEDGDTCGGGWEDGYIAFVDVDGDGTLDTGGATPDRVVLAQRNVGSALVVSLAAGNGGGTVRFSPDGTALDNNGTFTFCDQRGVARARALLLTNAGQLRSVGVGDDDGCP